MGKTSIVIPTYNGKAFLTECIEAIRRHTPEPHEIIVVDNGSTDGTGQWCRHEDVVLISLPGNWGFPAACNKGLKAASGDTLLLLNNDVVVARNWLSNLLACLHSSPRVGIVGPVTNYASGKQQMKEPFTNIEDMAARFNNPDSSKWMDAQRIVGLCFLFTRQLMEKIGLLDERFTPGHFEDDDYCLRARSVGYQLKIAGDAFVFHHGSASFSRQEEEQVRQLLAVNRQKFVEKWGIDPAQFA